MGILFFLQVSQDARHSTIAGCSCAIVACFVGCFTRKCSGRYFTYVPYLLLTNVAKLLKQVWFLRCRRAQSCGHYLFIAYGPLAQASSTFPCRALSIARSANFTKCDDISSPQGCLDFYQTLYHGETLKTLSSLSNCWLIRTFPSGHDGIQDHERRACWCDLRSRGRKAKYLVRVGVGLPNGN